MGWIYKITNQINGKMYIGKTEHADPIERWKEHIREKEKDRSKNRPFYRALNKYGIENFDFQVIDECNDSNNLCELEVYYIDKYRTFVGFDNCNGYNCTIGGDGKAFLNLDEDDVVNYHVNNGYMIGKTANYFGCDRKTIKNILEKHNIDWYSHADVANIEFYKKYGGLVQMNIDCTIILNIYNNPKEFYEFDSKYKYKTLSLAYFPSSKTHHAYGYTWYRLSELPEEYKPLLQEYYASHLEEDSLEITDDFEYIYE